MQIEVSPEEAEALAEGLEILIQMNQHAKDHLLECPSVESPEMLCDVVSDYDMKIVAYMNIREQLKEWIVSD
jgi:hypothetical protein